MLLHSDQWLSQHHILPSLYRSISALISMTFVLCGAAMHVLTLAASCPGLPWSQEIDLVHQMQLFVLLQTLQHNPSPVSNQAVTLPAVSNCSFSKRLMLEQDGSLFSAFPPHCGGHCNQQAHVICSYDMTKHEGHMTLILQAREANYRLNLV